jgi:hypothetical protein
MHQHDAIRSWDSDGLPANEPMSIGADIIPIKTAIGVGPEGNDYPICGER